MDKQEIKTVRIVKRESEKRQRDRDKGGVYGTSQYDEYEDEQLSYEPTSDNTSISNKPFIEPSKNYFINDKNPFAEYSDKSHIMSLSDAEMIFGNLHLSDNLATGLTNTDFQSESARHIISELDHNSTILQHQNDADQYRRSTPKKKKRHFTAPNNSITQAVDSYSGANGGGGGIGSGGHQNVGVFF